MTPAEIRVQLLGYMQSSTQQAWINGQYVRQALYAKQYPKYPDRIKSTVTPLQTQEDMIAMMDRMMEVKNARGR